MEHGALGTDIVVGGFTGWEIETLVSQTLEHLQNCVVFNETSQATDMSRGIQLKTKMLLVKLRELQREHIRMYG